MVAARPPPRTSMCTWRAVRDRNTAAWPAELPPPTTTTSSPRAELGLHRGGGVVDALALEAARSRARRACGSGRRWRRRPRGPRPLRRRRGGAGRVPCAVEAGDRARDREPGAELLRLDLRAAGQRLAGDAGRESRGSSRSSSWSRPARRAPCPRARWCPGPRTRRRPRRRARPARRRPPPGRRPASGSIVSVRPRLVGERGVVGLRRTRWPGAITTGSWSGVSAKQSRKPPAVGVELGVEQPVRVAVADQEALQPQRVGGVARADQHDPALGVPDQARRGAG